MKKLVSLILVFALFCSLASCSKTGNGDETKEIKAQETEKNVQNYEELEYESTIRFTADELLSFSHSEGTFKAEKSQLVSISEDGAGEVIPFSGEGYAQYSSTKAPFGVTVGDGLEKLVSGFSLDTGYAAYVQKGGAFVMYDEEEEIDISSGEGGCIYFAYARDKMNNWAFLDYQMLTQVIEGRVVMQGTNGEYDIIIYSVIVDDDRNISQITMLYGEINTIMSIINSR